MARIKAQIVIRALHRLFFYVYFQTPEFEWIEGLSPISAEELTTDEH
jgi:hypothetical protein